MTLRLKDLLLPLLILIIIIFSPAHALAKGIADQDIPETLKPWVGWVLHGQEEKRCPSQYDNTDSYRCSWPSRLQVEVDNRGGSFSQKWQLYKDDWVYLPGRRSSGPGM